MRPSPGTWLVLGGAAAAGLGLLLLREMSAFSEMERRIAGYCGSIVPGATLADARARALAAGLGTRDLAATQWHPPILSVGSSHAWLKGSACGIRHNGASVMQASHDPWYQ